MKRLKENIIYGLRALKKRKTQSLFLLIQISCSILLMCYVLANYYDSKNVLNHIDAYMDGKNIYTIRNLDTYDLREKKDEKIILDKYKKVYSKIIHSKVDKIIVDNTVAIGDESGCELNTLQVSPNFLKKYNIKISKKVKSIEDTFKMRHGTIYNRKEVPVYIGPELGKKYKINEIINTDVDVSFKVVGLLESGQSISLPMQEKESTSVDDMILIPFYLDLKENFVDYLEALQFVANDKEELREVADVLNEEKIIDFYFKNYNEQLQYIKKDYTNLYAIFLSIGIIISTFSIISIIGMIIQIIQDSEYEYGVSMMCGARRGDIFVRLATQIIFVFALGIVLLYLCFGVTKSSNSTISAVVSIIALVLIYGWRKIKVGEIISKIKKSE